MNETTKPEPLGYDPKGAIGATKAPLQLIPAPFLHECSWVAKSGAAKYGAYNWRKAYVESQTYVGAIMRHLTAWQDGEDLDPESGRCHLAHVAMSCAILIDAKKFGTLKDNRPPRKETNE